MQTGVEYTPGQLLAVITPATVVVVDAPTDWSLAGPLWELALDDAPIDEILDCLIRRGIRTAPTFAVIREEESAVRVLVRGPVRVGVERTGDPVRLDASGATTWLEAVVSTPRRVLVGNVDPATRPPYLVATGVVLAGGLVLPCGVESSRADTEAPARPATEPEPARQHAGVPAGHDEEAPVVDLTRLESPVGAGVMAGRTAWMESVPPVPAPGARTEAPSGRWTRQPEPARAPAEEPVQKPADEPAEDEVAARPPGPSPADLPALDPPSVPVPLPQLASPVSYAPPAERPGADRFFDRAPSLPERVSPPRPPAPVAQSPVAPPAPVRADPPAEGPGPERPPGLPQRVRGESMPADLRSGRPMPPGSSPSVPPPGVNGSGGYERAPFERPPSPFGPPSEPSEPSRDRPAFQRPPYDRPAEQSSEAPEQPSGRPELRALEGRGAQPPTPAPEPIDRPRPPSARPVIEGSVPAILPAPPAPAPPPDSLRPPTPIRPPGGDQAGGPTPLPAFFRGTRVARESGPGGFPGPSGPPFGPPTQAEAPAAQPLVPGRPPAREVAAWSVAPPAMPGVLRPAQPGDEPTGEQAPGAAGSAGPVDVTEVVPTDAAQYAPETPREPPRLLGVWCDAGHVTSPESTECRVCGLPVPPQAPILVARPPLGVLVFDNGERVQVDGPIILGRDPKPVSGGPAHPLLHPVQSATGQVSRTHAQVRTDGWDVVVTDLDAMNGTTVTVPGGEPEPLDPGVDIVIEPGTRVDLGGETGFAFEVEG